MKVGRNWYFLDLSINLLLPISPLFPFHSAFPFFRSSSLLYPQLGIDLLWYMPNLPVSFSSPRVDAVVILLSFCSHACPFSSLPVPLLLLFSQDSLTYPYDHQGDINNAKSLLKGSLLPLNWKAAKTSTFISSIRLWTPLSQRSLLEKEAPSSFSS